MNKIEDINKSKQFYICPICNAIFNSKENKLKFSKEDNIVNIVKKMICEKVTREYDAENPR